VNDEKARTMRIRTLLTLGVGAAMGAGVTYLADPDHGAQRRAEARRWAMAQGRQQLATAGAATARAVQGTVVAAVEGYRDGRLKAS
jgi:hypothetical protein